MRAAYFIMFLSFTPAWYTALATDKMLSLFDIGCAIFGLLAATAVYEIRQAILNFIDKHFA